MLLQMPFDWAVSFELAVLSTSTLLVTAICLVVGRGQFVIRVGSLQIMIGPDIDMLCWNVRGLNQ